MFNNLFAYFGPILSAVVLLGLVLLLFVVAAAETVRLLMAGQRQRPCLAAIRLMRARQRVLAGWAEPAHTVARWSRSHRSRRVRRRE